jgi:hypothetical protein
MQQRLSTREGDPLERCVAKEPVEQPVKKVE